MINEEALTDPSICPSCSAKLGSARCAQCGIRLDGTLAARLWKVSNDVAALVSERRAIIDTLRREAREWRAAPPALSAAPAAVVAAMPQRAPAVPAPATGPASTVPAPATAAAPSAASRAASVFPVVSEQARPETTPRTVQEILLGLGALLLSVAGLVFVAVSWGSMGIGGRSAIMGAITAAVVAGAAVAHRRELRSTAEALGVLAVVFMLVDAYGLFAIEVFAGDIAQLFYWSAATATIAVVSGVGARLLPLAALRVSAAGLGQCSGWLLAGHMAIVAPETLAPAAAGLAVVAALLMLSRALLPRAAADARLVVIIGQPIAAVAALVVATSAAFDDRGAAAALGVLAVLVVIGAVAAYVAVHTLEVFAWSFGAATAAAVALGRVEDHVASGQYAVGMPAAIAAAALCSVLVVVRALAAAGRPCPRGASLVGPVLVAAVVVTRSLSLVVEAVVAGVVGPLSWLTAPWGEVPSVVGRAAVTVVARPGHALAGVLSPGVMLLLVALAVAVAAGGALVGRGRYGVAGGLGLLTLAGHVQLVMLAPLGVVLAADLGMGVLLWVAAGVAPRVVRGVDESALRPVRVAAGGGGLVLLVVAAGWSFLSAGVTLLVLPVVAAALAAAAVVLARRGEGVWADQRWDWSVTETAGAAAAGGAVVLGAAELLAGVEWLGLAWTSRGVLLALAAAAAAAVSYVLPLRAPARRVAGAVPVTGVLLASVALGLAAPSEAALSAALAATAAGALAGATSARGIAREAWSALATALIVAASAAAASWAGAQPALTGLVAVTVAALLLAAAHLVHRPQLPLPATARPAIELVSTAALTLGVLGTAVDLDVLWVALLVAGVAVAVVALNADRRPAAFASSALLVLSWWVRLADSGVAAPEAYTAPGAAALLVVGWFRRRRDPAAGSWTAYGAPLVLLLGPSLAKAAIDTGATRPLLLGAVALAVFLVGAARRLQAPLAIGGAVLALDALVQLGPELAALYATVPKWVSLGAVGLLLLLLGATYERRLGELRRIADGVSGMQ